MSVLNETAAVGSSGPPGPRHSVQFYEKEEFLYGVVADYAANALVSWEPVVIIATEEHKNGFVARLRDRGFDDLSQVTFMDARETLSRFMDGNMPDEQRFVATIGSVIE